MIVVVLHLIRLALIFTVLVCIRAMRRHAEAERRKLLEVIREMNHDAVLVYHCADGRCSLCWGNAKHAHDLALSAFEERGLGQP